MRIIIVGAGEVGHQLTQSLSGRGHDVTLIEESGERCDRLDEEHNARIMNGNGSSARVLVEANIGKCDAFLAMTSDDRTNIISCSLAKGLGAKQTVARIHDETYGDSSVINFQLHFGIDLLVNPEAICAVEVAKVIRNPSRVAVENFARGQIEVQQLEVDSGARVTGRKLSELKLDPGIRVGYYHRDGQTRVAAADTILQGGDSVTLFGHPETLYQVRGAFTPRARPGGARVVLVGGTETAIALVRLLTNPRFKIRIIERDPVRCRQLAEQFPSVTVIQGDATSLRLLEEEQIGSADYFVSCTKDDEDNIMTCLQASKLGARHVLLVMNKGDYDDVLETLKGTLNIEHVVSPRRATARFMENTLSEEPAVELARLPDASGVVLEVRIGHGSPCVGKPIREIALPRGTLFVALLHKYKAKVPQADDTILAGDRVVVIVGAENRRELLERLT